VLISFYFLGYTPILVAVIYFFMSCLTFLVYARDKQAAQQGTWRVSESTLHIFSLLCGWPGAIVAQQKLRHKTIKTDFRAVFWITVLLNSLGLIWLHTDQGSPYLHGIVNVIENAAVNELASGDVKSILVFLLGYR
tara:strand:+ start:756 stop:1163 length:408 start_codon:yes stop_codon:yes gene_type:complete